MAHPANVLIFSHTRRVGKTPGHPGARKDPEPPPPVPWNDRESDIPFNTADPSSRGLRRPPHLIGEARAQPLSRKGALPIRCVSNLDFLKGERHPPGRAI